MLVPDRSVPRIARYTWARQWRAEVCAGAVEGLIGLAGFAAMRSLGAKDWIAPLFVTFGQLFWLLAPMWEAAFARFHARAAFLWMGVIANAPLLFVAFVDPDAASSWGLWLFAGAVIVQAAVDAAYVPHRGALLRANFPETVRGRFFGILSTISKLASIVTAKAGGWLLDADPRWLRVVFPAAGLFGLCEHWTISRIRWRRAGRPAVRRWSGPRSAWAAASDAWRETRRILREDRAFLTYEIGFMFYGIGFLMSTPMIVVYAERDLALSYDAFTWAQGFSSPAAYVVTIFFFGRIVDRLGVVRTTAWAFALLASFFYSLVFVTTAVHLVASFAVLGVSMAVVNLGWNLGPLAFAPDGKARSYSTIHVLCVGIRSVIAPFLGLWVADRAGGAPAVFACSAALVAFAWLTLSGLARRSPAAAMSAVR